MKWFRFSQILKEKKEIRPKLLMELIDRLNSVSNNYHKIQKEVEILS